LRWELYAPSDDVYPCEISQSSFFRALKGRLGPSRALKGALLGPMGPLEGRVGASRAVNGALRVQTDALQAGNDASSR